jgi:Zn-dependent protease/CBS domain-containing protein
MFKHGIRLPFGLAGIPVVLDWSFLVMLPLLAWMIGSRVELFAEMFDVPAGPALTGGVMPFLLGLVAATGLFAGVVLHELGHALTARAYGVKVRGITLWLLGGVAEFEEMPRQRGAEAVVAIVGPIVSVALGGLCWLILQAVPDGAVATRFVLEYLTYMNIVLAVFNLLPALPLDGGRVLRSLLALKMPHARATQIAGSVSRVLAVTLGILGLFSLNFFLLLVAIFIFMAVGAETSSAQIEPLLRGVPVWRIMNRDVRSVSPGATVADLTALMMSERHLGFPVVDEAGRVLGGVSIREIQGIDPQTSVEAVMTPQVLTISEDADAMELFLLMGQSGFRRAVVLDGAGRLAGIITKTDLMRLIQIRALGPEAPPPR